jgi:Amt family ammonium transporter
MNVDPGDIAWKLVSAALVLFMVPGLAFFYAGMVRTKNVLNMIMMNMACLGIVPIIWVLFTYSMGNAGDNGFIGGFDYAGLQDLRGDQLVPVIFLMTFAAITPALISGAVADRMKFSAWVLFVPLWSILVYTPVIYWIYGVNGDGELVGWLGERGSLDFAGGTAIHINAGVAALAMVLVLGKRRGWPSEGMPPHNMTLVMLGTGVLWFGWFGFNAGSATGANGIAVQAFLNTFLAGAAAMVGWLLVERLKNGHFTTLGAASGIVAGLVAITPCAGFVGGLASIPIGLVAGVACFYAIQLKFRFGYDDALDVVGVHMVGGIIGGVLLGFFADANVNEGIAKEGVFFGGGADLLLEQLLSIVVVLVFSFVVTFVIAKVIDALIGLRVTDEHEQTGLDQSEHAEAAYNLASSGFHMDRVH